MKALFLFTFSLAILFSLNPLASDAQWVQSKGPGGSWKSRSDGSTPGGSLS